ncbi:MAG: HlyD family efflux transporter periplasmic adaptor subunit [Alphaproteobacteria bacterium]|nr:MAG: HlyD family efflux transporter periplasmic adaptor subunit [Alphaproteobacteria bacterium]
MMRSKNKSAVRGAAAVVFVFVAAALAVRTGAQETARASRPEAADDKRWQTVAPGRVEPSSGEVRIAAPVMGVIAQVLVKVNDKVTAGEPLIRLVDDEAQARLAAAEAQVAFRLRARNEEAAPVRSTARRTAEAAIADTDKAAARRRAEDAVADADKAVAAAQAALDKAMLDRRAGRASDINREALSRAQDRLQQQKAELRRIEADANTPLANFAEGQVNGKPGELASPTNAQPLLVIGDVSALRVRAELDERDFGEIKIGQPVLVRAAAFRGREFAGKVSFIAPLVEQGRISARGQRNVTDVDVVEVLVDLTQADPLAVGMKVDVYFQPDGR